MEQINSRRKSMKAIHLKTDNGYRCGVEKRWQSYKKQLATPKRLEAMRLGSARFLITAAQDILGVSCGRCLSLEGFRNCPDCGGSGWAENNDECSGCDGAGIIPA